MKILRLTFLNEQDQEYVLQYELYDTPLTEKWISITKKNLINPDVSIHTVFNNKTVVDVGPITEKIKKIVSNINQEYDKTLPLYEKLDNDKLNILHEEFEVFGQRMKELHSVGKLTKTLKDNFFDLNEYIHMCENAQLNSPGRWGPYGILYDLHPLGLHRFIDEEDKLMLRTDLEWGKLYLGYNTLGKSWINVFKDNDPDVVARSMVKPQRRFAAEAWLNFGGDDYAGETLLNFYKWCRSLPLELRNKIPLKDLNELTLGRFILGELIIDENFLKIDKEKPHWKSNRHPCKLKWNLEVLSKFRKLIKIEFVENDQ